MYKVTIHICGIFMKNRNLLLAAFLAVPFLLISDNVIETEDNEENISEQVIAEEEVASESEPLPYQVMTM